jgi:prophage antirepressor-like protein
MEQNLFNQPKETQISIFDFEAQQVRTVIIDNDIWFVASDVTRILGYVNGKQAIIEHCKGVYKKYPLMTSGGMQELSIINESGIYKLVLASKKPEAIKFKEWVTEKILPSIRKTGSYSVTPKPELSIEQMTLMVIENLQTKIQDQSKQLELQKPKVEFADKVVNTNNAISVREFGKVIGMGEKKFFEWLRNNKLLMESNMPYQKYVEAGYFKVIEWVLEAKNQVKFKTLITGKGQLYIAERIK